MSTALLPLVCKGATVLGNTALIYVPRTMAARMILITLGGTWVRTGIQLFNPGGLLFDLPGSILRNILFNAVNNATMALISTCGRMAASASYLVLKGTTKGMIIVVKLTGQASVSVAQSITGLARRKQLMPEDFVMLPGTEPKESLETSAIEHHEQETILPYRMTESTIGVQEISEDWILLEEMLKDWVLLEDSEEEKLPLSMDEVRSILETVDLKDAQIEIYPDGNPDSQPIQGSIEDIKALS